MRYKKGDIVSVLDEDITGTVLKVEGETLTIETTDGFPLEFNINEVVRLKNTGVFLNTVLETKNINAIAATKDETKRRKPKKMRPKAQAQFALEVDLHIHKLVNSTKGMTNYDMLNIQLDTAQRKLDFAITKRMQRVVFIHGVGEGVLKLELETLFRRYDNIKYYEANYQKYGLGATEVYIFQNAN